MTAVRAVVGSPSPLMLDVLDLVLVHHGVEVLARASHPETVLTAVRHHRPDVVVAADLYEDSDPPSTFVGLLSCGVGILVAYSATSTTQAFSLLLAGATGCIGVEVASAEELAGAARAVAQGHVTLHPAAAAAVLGQWRALRSEAAPGGSASPPSPLARHLTVRERDVLTALVDGLSTRESANRLGVSPKTVEAHRARLFSKLGARNQAHAVTLARRHGWVDGSTDTDHPAP